MLYTPNQPRLTAPYSRIGHRQHSREAQSRVYGRLLKAPEPEAPQQQPLLSPAEQPLHAPPSPEQLHQPLCPTSHEVFAHFQGVLDPGVPPHRDDRLRTELLGGRPHLGRAVLGVSQHRLELYAQGVHLFQQRLEVDLVVLVSRGHGEGEGHLRLYAACGVHPVSEDETSSASAYAGFGVALAGAVVRGSLAVGFYVGAVDGDDRSLHTPILQQSPEQLVEDSVVGVLA